jgi:hypothetical protein
MYYFKFILSIIGFGLIVLLQPAPSHAQTFPVRYATLELFTNTPCPICGSQNPGLFNRLTNFEGEYHLISFYPGKPYSSCVFYQDNITQNTTRFNHYSGNIFGSPTVAINGIDFKSSSGITNMVLENITGGTSWLYVDVEETTGTNRTVSINLEDVVGGSLTTGRLFAVIVEKEIQYNAPNGETVHHNVFRRFLTSATGDDVDMSSGNASLTYDYTVDGEWNADQTYVIAWLSDPTTKEIYNSGTRFDPDFTSAVGPDISKVALQINPNPSSIEATVLFPTNVSSANVQVFDAQGRIVYDAKNVTGPEVKIATSQMDAGYYVVRLMTSDQIFTGRFEVLK